VPNTIPRRDVRLTVCLTPDVATQLRARAMAEDRTLSALMSRLLRDSVAPKSSEAAGQGSLAQERGTTRDAAA
jgi:hypothetical protein